MFGKLVTTDYITFAVVLLIFYIVMLKKKEVGTTDYITIALVILILYGLMFKKKEGFSVLPEWPYIPPRYWSPRKRQYWSPWWYYENEYHPAVPKVVNYDSTEYRFPDYKLEYTV